MVENGQVCICDDSVGLYQFDSVGKAMGSDLMKVMLTVFSVVNLI